MDRSKRVAAVVLLVGALGGIAATPAFAHGKANCGAASNGHNSKNQEGSSKGEQGSQDRC
jgi:hypothetical protein